MKKHLIFLGLVFAALVFASCKLEKGGTIEVINGHPTDNASIYIMKGSGGTEPVVVPKTAGAGETATFSIDEDGTYTVNAIFYSGSTPPPTGTFTGHGDKAAVLSGGNKVSVSVSPSP